MSSPERTVSKAPKSGTSASPTKGMTGKRHDHRKNMKRLMRRNIVPRSQVKKYVNQGGGYLAEGDLVKLVNSRLKKRTKEFQKYLAILCQYTRRKKVDTEMIQMAYYYFAKGPMLGGTMWGQYDFTNKKKSGALVCST